MPGIYTSFIKAGRVTVPVELHFIPSKVFEDITGKESLSTKWAALKHWREIKDMLKPAVETAIKYHNDATSAWEKNMGQPHIVNRMSTALGYVYEANNRKYTEIMDPKDTWTDDEDEEDDENMGLRDYGGRFIKFPPTKVYIKACALLRTPSRKDDEKKITKELGLKPEVYNSFFQLHNHGHDTSPSCSSSNKKNKSSVYSSSNSRKKLNSTNILNGASMNRSSGYHDLDSLNMSSTSGMDYLDNDQFNPMRFGRSPASSTSLDDLAQRDGASKDAQINDDELWALRGTYYEEKDDDDYEDSMGLYGYSNDPHSTNSMLDDEDDESLPDIDCPPVILPPITSTSPTRGAPKPIKKPRKRDSSGAASGKSKNSKRQKLTDEFSENAQPSGSKKKTDDQSNERFSFDKEHSLHTTSKKSKRKDRDSSGKKDKNHFLDSLSLNNIDSSKKSKKVGRSKGSKGGKRKSSDLFSTLPGIGSSRRSRHSTSGKKKDKDTNTSLSRKERRNSEINSSRSVLIEKVSSLNTPLSSRLSSSKDTDKFSRSPQKDKEKDTSSSRIPELPEVLINAEDLRKEIGADKYGSVFNNSLDYNNPKFITITASAAASTPLLSSGLSKSIDTSNKSHKSHTSASTSGGSSSLKKSISSTPKVQKSLRPKRKTKLSLSFTSDKDKDSHHSHLHTPASSSLKSIEKPFSISYSPSSVNTNVASASSSHSTTLESRKSSEKNISSLDACLKSLKTAAERKDYASSDSHGNNLTLTATLSSLSASMSFRPLTSKSSLEGIGNNAKTLSSTNVMAMSSLYSKKGSRRNRPIDSDAESVILLKETIDRRRRRRKRGMVVKQERQESPVHQSRYLNNLNSSMSMTKSPSSQSLSNSSTSTSTSTSTFEIDPEMPVLVMQVTPEEFLRRCSPTPVYGNVPAPVLQVEGNASNSNKKNTQNHNSVSSLSLRESHSYSHSYNHNSIQTRQIKTNQIGEAKMSMSKIPTTPSTSSLISTLPSTLTTTPTAIASSSLAATLSALSMPQQVSQPSPTKPSQAPSLPSKNKRGPIKKSKSMKGTGVKKPKSFKNAVKKPKSFRSASISRLKRYPRRVANKTEMDVPKSQNQNQIQTPTHNQNQTPTQNQTPIQNQNQTPTQNQNQTPIQNQNQTQNQTQNQPQTILANFSPTKSNNNNDGSSLNGKPAGFGIGNAKESTENHNYNHVCEKAVQSVIDQSIILTSGLSSSSIQQQQYQLPLRILSNKVDGREISTNLRSQSSGLAAIQEAYASDSDEELAAIVASSNDNDGMMKINVGPEYYTLDLNRNGEFQLQELGANVIDDLITHPEEGGVGTFNPVSIPYEEGSDNDDLFSFEMEHSGGNTIELVINNNSEVSESGREIDAISTSTSIVENCDDNNALTAEEIPHLVLVGSRPESPESSPAFSPVGSPMVSPSRSPPPVEDDPDSRAVVLYNFFPSSSPDTLQPSLSPESELKMPPPMFRPPRTPKKKAMMEEQTEYESERMVLAKRKAPASPGQKRALAAVGVQVHPSRLSTLEIATNPHFFNAGIELCNQIVSKQTDVKEIKRKIFREPSPCPARPVSPDITLMYSVKNKTRKLQEDEDSSSQKSSKSKLKIKLEDEKGRKPSDDGNPNQLNVVSDVHEGGVALIKELVSRMDSTSSQSRSYEPVGDEYDLSQGSYCMLNVFPEYGKKSRKYKQNAKNILALTDDEIRTHFKRMLPTLKDVACGKIESDRRPLCANVPVPRAKLSQLSAISPFTNAQASFLVTLIEEKFTECPDDMDTVNYSDFVNYVMLPETAIRVYATVNNIEYSAAEQEMIHGATCVNTY